MNDWKIQLRSSWVFGAFRVHTPAVQSVVNDFTHS